MIKNKEKRKEEVKIELRMKAVTTVSTDDKGMVSEHYKQSSESRSHRIDENDN